KLDPAMIEVPSDILTRTQNARIPALNEVSSRAIRDFNKNYKDITNVNWFQSSIGFIAAFVTEGNVKSFNYYDKKGVFQYMIRYYKEDRLSNDVRHLVKSKYYDFDINQITEVTRNGKMAYVIKLDDKDHWKTIKVVEDEIQELDEFSKG
ncbi:MAG TPA: hypothetical protein VM101_01510, partial [Flavitalea sp.]|nr:hypothetical protein [Flavitalea sp.]